MGVEYFVACRTCKTFRQLDKFYTMLDDVHDRASAIAFADRIEKDSFRAGLLVSFMWKHRGHDCYVCSEFEDYALGLFEEESINFWHLACQPTEVPNPVTPFTQAIAEHYVKTVDSFMRQLGVTQEDRDVRLVQFANNQDLIEVWRGDNLLGTILRHQCNMIQRQQPIKCPG